MKTYLFGKALCLISGQSPFVVIFKTFSGNKFLLSYTKYRILNPSNICEIIFFSENSETVLT